MRKILKYIFIILFSAGLFFRSDLAAQTDSFFAEYEMIDDNRAINDWLCWNFCVTNFGDDAPLSDGIVILLLFGILYAMFKKSDQNNKLMIMIALLLLPLSYGCKKRIELDKPADKYVEIKFISQQPKTDISPLGVVTWSNNDLIHVYSNHIGYLGSIEYQNDVNNTFSGYVISWEPGDSLYFYYMGTNTPTSGKTLTINYSDQSYEYEIGDDNIDLQTISQKYQVAVHRVLTEDKTTTFSGTLRNVMALGYFNTESFGDYDVKLYAQNNLYNLLSITPYGNLVYGVAGINTDPSIDNQSGHIILGHGNSEKYIALLPKNEKTSANISAVIISNDRTSTDRINIEIKPNGFIHGGTATTPMTINSEEYTSTHYVNMDPPTVGDMFKFTINSDKSSLKKIVFAKGNLVYNAGRCKRHANQYNIIGDEEYSAPGNVGGLYDRFGWMTSGHDGGNLLYQPYTLSNAVNTVYKQSNGYGYGPYNGKNYEQSCFPGTNGTLEYRKCDWGWYQFGVNMNQQTSDGRYWRVMGNNEWLYLFDKNNINRSLNNEKVYALFGYGVIKVNGTLTVKGVIILPDLWDNQIFVDNGVDFAYGSLMFEDNIITSSVWEIMEENGAVFLPVDGYRNNSSIDDRDNGYYWGCKHNGSTNGGCFYVTEGQMPQIKNIQRYKGCFVRLVYQTDGGVW